MSKATVQGIRMPKDVAAVLASAIDQGFRVEPSANGKHDPMTGVVVYSPDKDMPPARFGVAIATPAHTNNIRRNLRRMGWVDPDKPEQHDDDAQPDVIDLTEGVTDMSRRKTSQSAEQIAANLASEEADYAADLARARKSLEKIPHDDRVPSITSMAQKLLVAHGWDPDAAGLVSYLIPAVELWMAQRDRIDGMARDDVQELADVLLRERDEARKERDALQANLDREVAKREQAGRDCAAALERARVAETERDALDAALRPLRAILGQSS